MGNPKPVDKLAIILKNLLTDIVVEIGSVHFSGHPYSREELRKRHCLDLLWKHVNYSSWSGYESESDEDICDICEYTKTGFVTT